MIKDISRWIRPLPFPAALTWVCEVSLDNSSYCSNTPEGTKINYLLVAKDHFFQVSSGCPLVLSSQLSSQLSSSCHTGNRLTLKLMCSKIDEKKHSKNSAETAAWVIWEDRAEVCLDVKKTARMFKVLIYDHDYRCSIVEVSLQQKLCLCWMQLSQHKSAQNNCHCSLQRCETAAAWALLIDKTEGNNNNIRFHCCVLWFYSWCIHVTPWLSPAVVVFLPYCFLHANGDLTPVTQWTVGNYICMSN